MPVLMWPLAYCRCHYSQAAELLLSCQFQWELLRQELGKKKGQCYFLQQNQSLWGDPRLPGATFPQACVCPHAPAPCSCRVRVWVCASSLLTGGCEREVPASCARVALTMLLSVALGMVVCLAVAASDRAEISSSSSTATAPLLNYSRISLPAEHVPYFLNNNKRVAKLCQLDPHCPFKVRKILFFLPLLLLYFI